MAGPKAQTPAPIDRPISRAYLRQFTGLSTAYPPGLSDPTSLRIMENMRINRDGSIRIRPGLRYLSPAAYDTGNPEIMIGLPNNLQCVGTHEAFFLNDGRKAYLFAVRALDSGSRVEFRALVFDPIIGPLVHQLTDVGVDFAIPQGMAALAFTSATTYVKYLQVDNKIFALSDAGETMRIFYVGSVKSAKKLSPIVRPDWTVADKLTVVQPDAGWINNGAVVSNRINHLQDPSFFSDTDWTLTGLGVKSISLLQAKTGTTSMALTSTETRTNIAQTPLGDVATYGTANWEAAGSGASISASGSSIKVSGASGSTNREVSARQSTRHVVEGGKSYQVYFDISAIDTHCTAYVNVRFYDAIGQIGGDHQQDVATSAGRFGVTALIAPVGAIYMRVFYGIRINSTSAHDFSIKNVLVSLTGEPTTFFYGGSGADYYWSTTVNQSRSYYHPAQTLTLTSGKIPTVALANNVAAVWDRCSVAGPSVQVGQVWYDVAGTVLSTTLTSAAASSAGAWTRRNKVTAAPAGATHVSFQVVVSAIARSVTQFLDSGLFEFASSLGADFDGDLPNSPPTIRMWDGTPNASTSEETVYSGSAVVPPAEAPTANTLISDESTGHENQYNFGFFYTLENEIGESAASEVTVVSTQRSWSAFKWYAPNGLGEPSATRVADPYLAADQLAAIMPHAVFDAALAQGAIGWSLYVMTWSNQDSVPVEAIRVDHIVLEPTSLYVDAGYGRVTPRSTSVSDDLAQIPTALNRYNYSVPSSGGQGLVAADRMILVRDPNAQAVIRWTSNHQGEYTNFSAVKGGGYKTLTSGNLYIPACVKLWQNPQSVDTLTILCEGTDGMSTGYYMAPAQVTSQSDTTTIMGFEETTATPGTVSPFGCEVFNNALYHPIDEEIMKSTASNYNINHKSITDLIEPDYQALDHKDQIVSSQLENRIYYLINNPKNPVSVRSGERGNEVWVYDAGTDTGTWSRWLVGGVSLRKIEVGGTVVMSLVRAEGIYYFDELSSTDDYIESEHHSIAQQFITWRMETNTQGANRAHDAWSRLQQLMINLGNFRGSVEWGIRSWDINGKPVEIKKITRDLNPVDSNYKLPFDIEDYLQIRRDLKEWYLFANHTTTFDDFEEVDVVDESFGQINLVQYRYVPSTVNTGYEYGSVETFEYGRATVNWDQRTTDNGVPIPVVDVRRP